MDGVTYWFRHTAEPRAVPLGRRFAVNGLRDWALEHMSESVTLIASEACKHRSSVSKTAARHKAEILTPYGPRTCFEARIE